MICRLGFLMQNFNRKQNLFGAGFPFNIGKHTTQFGKNKKPPDLFARGFFK
jgi:hypothetical protein